jgi:hypothetical protein
MTNPHFHRECVEKPLWRLLSLRSVPQFIEQVKADRDGRPGARLKKIDQLL